MAGYDFDFRVPVREREAASNWLNLSRRLAKRRQLAVKSRSREVYDQKQRIYVTVDGSLPAMQLLQRELPHHVFGDVFGSPGRRERTIATVIVPFLHSNRAGVRRISETVFDISAQFASIFQQAGLPPYSAKPAAWSFSPRILERLWLRRASKRDDVAVRDLARGLDAWSSGRITKEQLVIICDQSVENFWKARLSKYT